MDIKKKYFEQVVLKKTSIGIHIYLLKIKGRRDRRNISWLKSLKDSYENITTALTREAVTKIETAKIISNIFYKIAPQTKKILSIK